MAEFVPDEVTETSWKTMAYRAEADVGTRWLFHDDVSSPSHNAGSGMFDCRHTTTHGVARSLIQTIQP